jgi:hypothetical protein
MKALSILSLFLLFGCAPSTQDLIEQAHFTGDRSLINKRNEAEERLYEHEDALILARERYEARSQACNEAGGVMMIHARATRLRQKFTRRDYQFAKCVNW